MTSPRTNILSPPALQVTLGSGADCRRLEFRKSVRIGRSEECEVCVKDEHVSRIHAEVKIENGTWYIRDLNSANGLYCLGERFESASIVGSTTIRLGIQGPEVSFKVVQPKNNEPTVASETVIARYVEHYFGKVRPPMGLRVNTRCSSVRPSNTCKPTTAQVRICCRCCSFRVIGAGSLRLFTSTNRSRSKEPWPKTSSMP